MSVIENILRGSIDMHIHAAPDPRAERSVDAMEAALQAKAAGMRAIVLKSHEYPTAALAYAVGKMVPEVKVFGSISLDAHVGGLNPLALEAAAKMGAKVVWMPTFTAAHEMKKKGKANEGISLFDANGKLVPVVKELLAIIKKYGMVLATGHVSPAESFALVDAARQEGIDRIVITHPLSENFGAHLTLEQQRQMGDKGAFIEHCFSETMPLMRYDPMKIAEAVKAVGAEHCIISTDLGQATNPAPAEGMRMAIAIMLRCGVKEDELELMVKKNPARLLGLT